MPQPPAAQNPSPGRRVRRKKSALRRRLDLWRKRWRKIRGLISATPPAIRTIVVIALTVGVTAMVNLVYHVIHKPTEMLFPVSGVLKKTPEETWRRYGSLFREYSTANVTPELLAALAQTEGAGDPVARTYWRWRLAWPPFEIFKPASSAVGMYQMTDATFADAKRYCIRRHVVIEGNPWGDWDSCWFTDLYTRVLPNHAVELTAVHLDRALASMIEHQHLQTATSQQKQELATIIHLCGATPAKEFAQHGFRLAPGERCGDHDVASYLDKVDALRRQFERIAGTR